MGSVISFTTGLQQFESIFAKPKDLIDSLSPEQVKEIVMNLGAERCDESEEGCFIFPTICHNHDSNASMKLYYYFNSKRFVCYTECDDNFNILELIMRVKQVSYAEAFSHIVSNHRYEIKPREKIYQSLIQKYERRIGEQKLDIKDDRILQMFPRYLPNEWKEEGITQEILDAFNIRFSPIRNSSIIPHYDIDGDLVGIRARNFSYTRDNGLAKYAPIKIEDVIYTHPLSYNLYGIYENRTGFETTQRAIIFEGEKSVLKHGVLFGERSCAVAACGSRIGKPQLDLLIKHYPIREITIAFDKEYKKMGTQQQRNYFNKLYEICKKYNSYCTMSFMFDRANLLQEKDAPIDRGIEIFNKLYQERIIVTE